MTGPDYFKIALKLLAVFSTVLSTLYYYLQKSIIHKTWFSPVIELIAIFLISYFFIIVYGLVKDVNLKDFTKKIKLNKYANDFYLIVISILILYSISPIIKIISVDCRCSIPYKSFFHFFLIVLIFVLMLYKFYKSGKVIRFIIFFLILFFSFYIALPMFNPPLSVIFQGNININMDNIYYKNSSPIPVYIEITGVNDELSIHLNKSYAKGLIQIDNITLGPNNNDENISGKNLIGNAFYSGKYYIFIITTNMTEGYYELVCKRGIDKFSYGKSFYLMNNGSN